VGAAVAAAVVGWVAALVVVGWGVAVAAGVQTPS
jgi:hypothetical protein